MDLHKNIEEQIDKDFFLGFHPDATGLFNMKLWEATFGQYTRIHPGGFGRPIFMDLHQELKIVETDSETHNCLACNLSDSIKMIGKHLKELKEQESEAKSENDRINFNYAYTIFILLLHLQTEKIFTLFKFIGITKKYQRDNWEILTEINLWANFIKHPKGFLFCHHPFFVINDSQVYKLGFKKDDQRIKILNYENFIKRFYNFENEEKFYKSIEMVEGKTHIFLKVTSPIFLMERFAVFCEELMKILTKNPFFKNQLIKKTSLEDYWKKMSE